jgi:hypothetical protein
MNRHRIIEESRKCEAHQANPNPVTLDTGRKLSKIVGLALSLAVFGSVCVVGIKAQQNKSQPNTPLVATNWIGYVVVGKVDSLDQIARGAYPTTDRRVEIGLRSDGIVVWRRASNRE